jgi:small subunit ribosomal protein S7
MRRRRAEKREVAPDPKHKNVVVSKFINVILERGKRSTAERIVYGSLEAASKDLQNADEVQILLKALGNVRPLLQLKSRRVGGATYQIPVEVREDKGVGMAMRWIRNAAESRGGRSMEERLAAELKDAYNNTGSAVKRKEEVHKMAEANRAFSHYRW